MIDPIIGFLLGLGVVVLLVAWLPLALRKVSLSLPIICVGLGWLTFEMPRAKLSGTGDGLVALGGTLVAYATTEVFQGYGFLAVFVVALMLRDSERSHEYHGALHDFAEQAERLLMMLVLFGGAISMGLFTSLTWTDLFAAAAIVFLIRPLAGWISLAGSGLPARERGLIAFFGNRGIGNWRRGWDSNPRWA